MPAENDFRNDPLGFMQNNVVYVTIPNDTTGLVDLTIELRNPAAVVSNKPGYNVFRLRLAKNTDQAPLRAYVCPYQQDTIQGIMLGNQAQWCFTPTMDGCTFGIGSQGPGTNGTVLVSHVNTNRSGQAVGEAAGLDGHRQQQRKMQRNLVRSQVGMDAVLIEPDTYMTEGGEANKLKSTTFGSHAANGPWTFHTQRYRYSGNTFFHGGVLNFP
ncbi:MAG TPA: hypothetical protein VF459_11780 [Caulobacteraceae bacterium]